MSYDQSPLGRQDGTPAHDLRRAASGLTGGRPHARLRGRVALRPFRADPGRPGWSLLGGVDVAVTPGGPDIAPAPRFEGRYYQPMQARCEPKPIQMPYPPFAFVGSGEQLTLRVVARYADVWNSMSTDVEEFRHKVRILH